MKYIIALLFSGLLFGQKINLEKLSGIYIHLKDSTLYDIINKNGKCLSLIITNRNTSRYFDNPITSIEKCGFIKEGNEDWNNLEFEGTTKDKLYLGNDYIFDYELNEDGKVESLELSNTNIFMLNRVNYLPAVLIKKLIFQSKKDKRDYIKEFLDIEFKKITTKKSLIHSAPNKPTKMYLIKGDEVEVLEEKNGWLNIRYYGKKTIEGWVKKEEVGK